MPPPIERQALTARMAELWRQRLDAHQSFAQAVAAATPWDQERDWREVRQHAEEVVAHTDVVLRRVGERLGVAAGPQ